MHGLDIDECAQLGDVGVGKTTLIRRYAGEAFGPGYNPTIGVDIEVITENVRSYANIVPEC